MSDIDSKVRVGNDEREDRTMTERIYSNMRSFGHCMSCNALTILTFSDGRNNYNTPHCAECQINERLER